MPQSEKPEPDGSPINLETSRFEPGNRRRLSGPGLRTFIAISDTWGLSGEQRRRILGDASRSTYRRWAKNVREHREITLSIDVLTRISLVLGIYAGLGKLFASDHESVAWLCQPHGARIFSGSTPLDLIVRGGLESLMNVRRFIDAAGTGLYMPPTPNEESFLPYKEHEIMFVSEEEFGASLLAPALRTFFRLAEEWQLSEYEQCMLLGQPASSELKAWQRGEIASANDETLHRISYLLGIYKAINLLLQDPARASDWLRAPNDAPLFGGKSALDRMLRGDVADLSTVRAYLDAQLT